MPPASATSERRVRRAAGERHLGEAGQSLELQRDLGVGAHRHRARQRDHGLDLARILCVERELCHFADPHTVEQHRGSGP